MAKLYIPIEFETDELLKEAMEIKQLADELGKKVFKFSIKASVPENVSSQNREETNI